MKKRFIFECDDYVEWEIEEIICLNPDGSYTPSYPNDIHILESRVNEREGFIVLKYHWIQRKLKNSNDFPVDLQADPSPSIVNEAFFDIGSLTNKELEQKLYEEFIYYSEDLDQLCKIIRKQLPRKMVYRLISKLYRLRRKK